MGLETNKVKYKESWELVKLSELCTRISDGVHFKPEYLDEGIPFISVKDIYNDNINFDNCKYISIDTHKELIKRCYPEKDDVLITKSGTIGRMALVPEKPEFSLFVSVALIKNIKQVIDSKFLKFCLENFLNHINVASDIKGGLLKNFHLEDIRQTIIPKILISEQHAIVSKIEELFSELDKGITELKTAQQQLKTYRQSVLKSAFEGKLTNENVKDGELPDGWEWKTFSDVCVRIGDIDHKMPKKTENGKYPYLSTKDITNDFKLSFDNVKLISEEDYLMLSRKIKPEKGDIIFPRYGTIGKNVLVDTDKKFLISYSCAIIKPNTNLINEKYIYLFSLSPKVTDEIRKYVVETTQANIGIGSIKSFVFPLAPLEDQHRVVQEIESRLSVADKMEQSIQVSLQKAEVLRQSILKKAFSGELV